MNLKHLLTVLSLLVLLAFVISVPRLLKSPSEIEGERVSNVDCDLNMGDCQYLSSIYGDITVAVSPSDLPVLKPLNVSLISSSQKISKAIISLDGRDMYMGVNKAFLKRSTQDSWDGVITIPVCTIDDEMVWLFSITLHGAEPERLVFTIKSTHPQK
ncbi:hypothetical protein [Alkalimarinus coralli]|uniref:hypothetical protein n=1 Tax=Alkalimarinus coralli TaxID=2935863 RepID=UPI00202B1D3A|nr:hypothetical protein [Alkalimarinus coralli]